jgi:hypothetical protein
MRQRFEKTLGDYGELNKSEQAAESEEELVEVQTVAGWLLRKAARRRGSSVDAQVKIYEIQKKKQEIMRALQEDLKNLDNADYEIEKIPDARPVMYLNKTSYVQRGSAIEKISTGGLHAQYASRMSSVTIGEIIADGEWGIEYDLDTKTVPRAVRKRYLVERAKRQLRHLLDGQIIIDELNNSQTHIYKREAYRHIASDASAEFKSGFIAERMIESFLTTIMYDLNADFKVMKADVYQDVEQKIDFIIKRKFHTRSVQVEEDTADVASPTERASLGIQCTINLDRSKLEHKERQIEQARRGLAKEGPVEDLVLVQIPSLHIRSIYEKWARSKTSGGPTKLWDKEVKVIIFREIMKGILTPQEIEEYCQRL